MIVIDKTDSMEAAHSEIISLMTSILSSVNISPTEAKMALVTFHFNINVEWDFSSATATDTTDIASQISALNFDVGGSMPYDAFVRARQTLDNQAAPSTKELVIFIYDGQESQVNSGLVRDMFEE